MRRAVFVVVFVAIAVTVVVVGTHGGRYATTGPTSPVVDRVAYVSADGQVWTAAPDGTDTERVSPDDGFFTWPTWSPDARKLAFSGVVGDGSEPRRAALLVLEKSSGRLSEVHLGEPGLTALVAEGAPHYVSWAPDSERLAFIGPTASGLRLYLYDLQDGGEPQGVLDEAPLYLAWAPESTLLLVHRREEHFLVDGVSGLVVPLGVPATGIHYRVPTWQPASDSFNYILTDSSGVGGLYTSGVGEQLVDGVPLDGAFLWSPDGSTLALTDPEAVLFFPPLSVRVFRRVTLYGPGGEGTGVRIEDDVVSFFWSPDSKKLAYLTPGEALGVLRWNVLDVKSGERWPLLDFRPSADQLTFFRFFDQYAGSHSAWSSDSTRLVLAGRRYGGAVSASIGRQDVGDVIMIVTVGRNPTADVIADGVLAVWSPR